MMLRQTTTTMAQAASSGLFKDSHAFSQADWEGRALRRPDDEINVYAAHYLIGDGEVVIVAGWVDGEEAQYTTLVEFEDGINALLDELWYSYLFESQAWLDDQVAESLNAAYILKHFRTES